jgi:hypothetical protein
MALRSHYHLHCSPHGDHRGWGREASHQMKVRYLPEENKADAAAAMTVANDGA